MHNAINDFSTLQVDLALELPSGVSQQRPQHTFLALSPESDRFNPVIGFIERRESEQQVVNFCVFAGSWGAAAHLRAKRFRGQPSRACEPKSEGTPSTIGMALVVLGPAFVTRIGRLFFPALVTPLSQSID